MNALEDELSMLDAEARGLASERDYALAELAGARAEIGELVAAARASFDGYCLDEADDWFDEGECVGENTGVTREHHAAANRLRDALAAMGKSA